MSGCCFVGGRGLFSFTQFCTFAQLPAVCFCQQRKHCNRLRDAEAAAVVVVVVVAVLFVKLKHSGTLNWGVQKVKKQKKTT